MISYPIAIALHGVWIGCSTPPQSNNVANESLERVSPTEVIVSLSGVATLSVPGEFSRTRKTGIDAVQNELVSEDIHVYWEFGPYASRLENDGDKLDFQTEPREVPVCEGTERVAARYSSWSPRGMLRHSWRSIGVTVGGWRGWGGTGKARLTVVIVPRTQEGRDIADGVLRSLCLIRE